MSPDILFVPDGVLKAQHLSDASENTDAPFKRKSFRRHLRWKPSHLRLKAESHLCYFCSLGSQHVSVHSGEERKSETPDQSVESLTPSSPSSPPHLPPPLASAAIDAHRNFMNFKLWLTGSAGPDRREARALPEGGVRGGRAFRGLNNKNNYIII